MKWYVAAAFRRMKEAKQVAQIVVDAGHEVMSTWHRDEDEADVCNPLPTEELIALAEKDMREIRNSDGLIVLTANRADPETSGADFEAGYAWALGKALVVIGPPENIFYEGEKRYADIPTFRDAVLACQERRNER